ncbi:MAG: metallophosphoesterase [Planctomycetota bacterium]
MNMHNKIICVALALVITASAAVAAPFTFGVMGDTQWSGSDPTGNNVNTVAVNQIKACNLAFVNAGVSFVVQVGDLCDTNGSTNAALQTRLDANSALNAADIPFYGLRGNHESSTGNQTFFNANYIPANTAARPVAVAPDTSSYAVTVGGTKIVLLDINTSASASNLTTATTWMDGQLKAADHTQSFVFSHKNLLGQNHKDNEFGSGNDANPAQQNAFIGSLQNNGVRYALSGHDHMHHRSMVASPDGLSKVQEIICASDSYKYYTPGTPYSSRETAISQQLYKTGYYLFTVDGPRVTGKYYETTPLSNGDVPANPTWTLSETFGYSLNGRQFLVPSGGNLNVVQDTYGSTTMHLDGTNSSTVLTYDGRLVTKDVNTGWTDKAAAGFASDALTLWGMEDIDSATTASAFTLTMSYQVAPGSGSDIYMARQLADGSWAPLASTLNGDGTVSATIGQGGTFAVVPEPATVSLLVLGGMAVLARRRNRR